MSRLAERIARLQRLAAVRQGHLDVRLADWVYDLADAYERPRASSEDAEPPEPRRVDATVTGR